LSGVCLTRNRRHGATRASVSDPGFVGGEVRAASAEAAATVKYVDPEAAKELVTKEGYTIVDIRDESQYKRSHIASSVHVPLFIENTDSDIGKGFSYFSPTQISWNLYQILTLVALLQPHAWSLQMMFVTAKSKRDRKLLRICVCVFLGWLWDLRNSPQEADAYELCRDILRSCIHKD
jgi:rhodanese-related sulfurtransferase